MPKSTNYIIAHKNGTRIKIIMLGYRHTRAQQALMLRAVAKIEGHAPRHYGLLPDDSTIRNTRGRDGQKLFSFEDEYDNAN